MFSFNAAGRYQLVDRLLGEVCKMCVDPSEVNGLLGELHKDVTEGMKVGEKKRDLEELVIVEGAEVQYGNAVLDMVERYGAKSSLKVRFRMMRRGWRK